MFVIVRYIDYRKEVSIAVLGSSRNLETAKEFVRRQIKLGHGNDAPHHGNKISLINYDNELFEPEYVHLADDMNGRIVATMSGYFATKTSEKNRAVLFKILSEETDSRNGPATVADLLNLMECSEDQTDKVAEHFDVTEIIEDNIPLQFEVLDYLLEHNFGYDDSREDGYSRDGDVFGIIEVKDIDTLVN